MQDPKWQIVCLEQWYNDTQTHKIAIMLIIARELTKLYHRGKEEIAALRDISLQIPAGAFVFIVGPSGCGKSTLLHLLGGMDRPSSGQLSVNGIALEKASEDQLTRFRRENIGFVFQFFNLLPSLDALQNATLPLLARREQPRHARLVATELLDQMGLASRKHHRPAELSGGEQQRVAIARAIIGKAVLIMADEPTGDLDKANAEAVMQLMRNLNQSLRVTFIVATHNETLIGKGDFVFELHNGELRER
jgi:ABC-type lipoprotein export system ATPase subunit